MLSANRKMMAQMRGPCSLFYERRKHGIFKLVDLVIDSFLTTIREHFYKPQLKSYGLLEALVFPKGIDYYTRYIDVAGAIFKHFPKGASILDVGAGAQGGISFFVRSPSHMVVSLDRKRPERKPWLKEVVVSDGMNLPFKDNSFDIVISVATIEHIKWNDRRQFLTEVRRTSKVLILHFPCEDERRKFLAGQYDLLFQQYRRKVLGTEDAWTAEHIACTHPSVKELIAFFPRSIIVGRKNCDVWLKYMVLSMRAIVGFLAGLFYLLFWGKKDNKPPFYECMLIYKKCNRGEGNRGNN